MKRLLYPLMLCAPVCLLSQTPAPAPAPSTPPTLTSEQTANIMKQLEQLEAQITKGRGDLFGMALSKCRAGAASEAAALSLYLDCYKVEHFDKRNLKTTDFQAWKDGNEGRLKDEEFTKGLVLQLEYLVLSIQAQDADEPKEMAPLVAALQAYLPRAVAAVQDSMKHTASGAVEEKDKGGRNGGGRGPGGGGRGPGGGGQLAGILRESVKATEFARALQLDEYMRNNEWEYSPLGIDGIYERVILPYYLETKREDVGTQWDARINAELALRKSGLSEAQYAEFYKERLPVLQWNKASYMLQNKVNPIMALADMLKIVRENPAHANAAQWLKDLRRSVNESQAPVVSPGADPAVTTPAPAPAST
ncbi:hypothetical protein DES53_10315 [Roseimicrobium gellanilyticum]|uniref:Uncharacterized protein n=1 Tax=Roseimicrobium gellanilyticum TaxID=748857 RepID=A0A366HND5_9BACT|nr:hypothetical protein [Roseimicrobium gellanilyticum]RBP45020.1 hypothetical protein DES53_10315 [Roseimicrobium gellanilyticum]